MADVLTAAAVSRDMMMCVRRLYVEHRRRITAMLKAFSQAPTNKEISMQLKCSFCSMPFALNHEQVAEAIEIFKLDSHAHYDAHCPKCRRSTKLAKKAFELNPIYKKMLEA
jgi:hypothetical protein